MRTTLLFLGGFLIAVLALSACGGLTLFAIALAFSLTLFYLHFPARDGRPWAFLIGLTVGLEALGTARFGSATLYAVIVYGLVSLFADLARFTSEYGRFIVSLILMLLAYPLIMLVPSHFFGALSQVALCFLVTAGAAGIIYRKRQTGYELV